MFSKSAKDDFSLLAPDIQKRILSKLEFFTQHNPFDYAKKIKNSDLGTYRFRIGDYRVIFDVDDDNKIIILLVIGHRREIYR